MSTEKIYDLVISNGRVMDPESGLDAVRSIGVAEHTIREIGDEPLQGRASIDAGGLVVSPGFIDLHSHGQDKENYEVQARDGVTTALELEVGAGDIDRWYAQREGASPINFVASIGHIPVRNNVMHDPSDFLPVGDAADRPASETEIEEMKRQIERGLDRGALAVGFGLQYTPAASLWEVLEVFRVAARYGASCHVHMRGMGHKEPLNSIEGLAEVIASASITGAPLHVVHIQSSGMRATPRLLQMIEEAQSHGMDVTTECYPYTAAMTGIESAMFHEGWQDTLGIGYEGLEWAETGERLTARSCAQGDGRHGDPSHDPRGCGAGGGDQSPDDDSNRRPSPKGKRTPPYGRDLLAGVGPVCPRGRVTFVDGRPSQDDVGARSAAGEPCADDEEQGPHPRRGRRGPDGVRRPDGNRPVHLPGPDKVPGGDQARAGPRRPGGQ